MDAEQLRLSEHREEKTYPKAPGLRARGGRTRGGEGGRVEEGRGAKSFPGVPDGPPGDCSCPSACPARITFINQHVNYDDAGPRTLTVVPPLTVVRAWIANFASGSKSCTHSFINTFRSGCRAWNSWRQCKRLLFKQ